MVFFEKRTKKLLRVGAGLAEVPSLNEQKFFASFFQKRSAFFLHDVQAARLKRKRLQSLLLSMLVAISMAAGTGRALQASTLMDRHAGMPMQGQQQPCPQHHHDLAGCACCAVACCAAVVPPLASVSAATLRGPVAYGAFSAFGRGIMTALDPDPPRLLML